MIDWRKLVEKEHLSHRDNRPKEKEKRGEEMMILEQWDQREDISIPIRDKQLNLR